MALPMLISYVTLCYVTWLAELMTPGIWRALIGMVCHH